MKKILLLCCSLILVLSVLAQDRVVTGRLTSKEDGSPMPGVNVVLKGTTNGTVTDVDGNYKLTVPDGSTLVFSFIGFETVEVEIRDKTTIDVSLSSSISQLSEVVVVGYGTQERRNLTGAITSVKGSEISNIATPSFDQQLAGRAAGVNVSTISGLIGTPPVIRIRGTSSISSGSDPLIVVDGMPVTSGTTSGVLPNNALADINPSDIESFEILKDGAASAIYGSRAAAGVILITTKKGKKGKAQVSYDEYIGISNTFRRYDLLNAAQFIKISNEKFANDGGLGNPGAPPQAFPMTVNGKPVDTDWQKLIFQTGFIQNHALSLRGASDKTNYFFSLGFTDQKGTIINNSQQRITARFNVDHHVTNWLKFGSDIGLTRTVNNGLNTGTSALSGNVNNAIHQFPNVPIKNPDGTYNISGATIGQGENLSQNDFSLPNLGYVLTHNIHTATNYRVLGNAHVEAVIHKDFTIRSQIGIDGLFTEDYQYWDTKQGDGFRRSNAFQQHIPTLRWDWINQVSYNRTFGQNHKIDAVGGLEYTKTTNSSFNAEGVSITSSYLGQNNIISNAYRTQTIGGGYNQQGFQSLFARVNYEFKDKYLIQGSIRRDQISSFTKSNNTGIFPSASIGWRLSGESFWKSSNFLNSINDFKLRASYAQTGNTNVGPYPYATLYKPQLYGAQSGLEYNAPGNINLTWETSKKFDYGLDVQVLEGRISLTADYFLNDIDNLLLEAPTPPSLGVPRNSVNSNIGSMQNKGFEVAVSADIIRGDGFTWSSNINYTNLHNKVTSLGATGDIVSNYQITRVGQSIGSFYGYQYEGVNKANGNPMYLKGDGTVIQGNIDDASYYLYNAASPGTLGAASSLNAVRDKRILGVSTPTYYGGWNNSFGYKGLDLNVFCRFSGGNKIFNASRQSLLTQQFANNGTEILQRWQSESNPGNGQVPRLFYGKDDFINQTSVATTRFLEPGDFFRVQNIILGYSLPKSALEKMKLTKLRIYVQVQNVFLITKYKGVDPESNSSVTPTATNLTVNTTSGVDAGVNPQSRLFTLGINVGL